MGSLHYMSPEQVRGSATLDERTDIYSLGAVLYEMSTGKRPFEASDPFSLMLAHVQQEPASPLDIDPSLPPGLSHILLTAMAKEPARRFSSADAFREALESLPEIAPASRVRRWPPSRVMRYSACALLCATLLIGVEKQELRFSSGAVEKLPVPELPDMREQPGDKGTIAPPVRNRPAPRATAVREKSTGDDSPPPSEISEESANDKRPRRRSWLARAMSKVVHPRAKRDGDAKPSSGARTIE